METISLPLVMTAPALVEGSLLFFLPYHSAKSRKSQSHLSWSASPLAFIRARSSSTCRQASNIRAISSWIVISLLDRQVVSHDVPQLFRHLHPRADGPRAIFILRELADSPGG